MELDLHLLLKWVVWTLVYSFLGIFIMLVAFFIVEKITKFSIKKELIEDENVALWIMFGCFFIAVAIIIAASVI